MKSFTERFNDDIYSFVNCAGNEALLEGTGSYSTPFRGSLYGEVDARKVDAELIKRGGVDVLWMGSNPNVQDSLKSILNASNDRKQLDSFIDPCNRRMYSEQGFDGGPGFDPIHHPSTRGWKLYNQLISKVGDIDSVAMANFVVWGSANFDKFLSEISIMDRLLLQRILAFSVELNLNIVKTLNPKLIVVPFSLGRNASLKSIAPEYLRLGKHCREHKVFGLKRAFTFYLQDSPEGIPSTRILHVPHPSSLRFGVEAEQQIIEAVCREIGSL